MTLNLLWWQMIATWVQDALLAFTAYVIWCYTQETRLLRQETQRQTGLQQPLVVLEATREGLEVRNIGGLLALNVRVREFAISPVPALPATLVADPIPTLLAGEHRAIQYEVLGGDSVLQGSSADTLVSLLKPISRIAKKADKSNFRPEITIEFQNLERQWYFVRERLKYGELEIIDFGPLRGSPPQQ